MKGIWTRLKSYSIKNDKKRILKNYYSKEMRKGKTYRASFLDKSLLMIFAFIILSGILLRKSDDLLLSCYISGLMMFFLFNITKIFSKKKKEKKIDEINENLKRKKLIREFSNLNKEGFINYTKVLLEEYYKEEIEKGEVPIDLVVNFKDSVYGIKCMKISMEDKISLRDLEIFQGELRSQGLQDGILITNSYFREDVREESRIILYDFEDIIEILKKVNRYSTDEDMEEYIVDRFMDKRNSIKKEIKLINKKKIAQLYGVFAVLYILSFFITYPRFYKIMAIICFLIATVVSGYKISEYIRLKDEYPLQ